MGRRVERTTAVWFMHSFIALILLGVQQILKGELWKPEAPVEAFIEAPANAVA